MTDDIVERPLSEEDSELATHPVGLLKEAADEIERLRMHTCSYDVATDICRAYKPNVERLARELLEAADEIERLRAALVNIYGWYPISVTQPRQTIDDMRKYALTALAGEKPND